MRFTKDSFLADLSQISIVTKSGNRFAIYDGETLVFSGNKEIPQHLAFLKNVATTISLASLAA